MNKKTIYSIFLIILIFIGIFLFSFQGKQYNNIEAVVYKSASCGCCGNYIPFLKQKGFEVNVITVQNISEIKNKYGVIENMESCHTVIIQDYFIEGHVPLKAIDKLLSEKPDIDGISLPNMPSGSPGMNGQKKEPFIIYQISNGDVSEFIRI